LPARRADHAAPSACPAKNATSVADAAGAVAPSRPRSQRIQIVSTTSAPAPDAK
jgi:hypothetical protein